MTISSLVVRSGVGSWGDIAHLITRGLDIGAFVPDTGDSHDPGIRKRLKRAERRRQEQFEEEQKTREYRKKRVISAFERVIEGKPEIPETVAEEIVLAIEAKEDIGPRAKVEFDALIASADKIQKLWNDYIDRDDEEVLMLL